MSTIQVTPDLVAARMMEQPVKTRISWPDGTETSRTIDWSDTKAKHKFGSMASRALAAGGGSSTEAVRL